MAAVAQAVKMAGHIIDRSMLLNAMAIDAPSCMGSPARGRQRAAP